MTEITEAETFTREQMLTEVDRRVERALFARDALSTRLAQVEKERDEALDEVDELTENAEKVSADFEGDCWKALRALLYECNFEWGGDAMYEGVTADDAREHIATTIDEIERDAKRAIARAEAAEAERDRLRASLTYLAGGDLGPAEGQIHYRAIREHVRTALSEGGKTDG